jgi:serine/threonine protein kinase
MRIGPYLVELEPIATGGQGIIYRGSRAGSTEDVAIKVVTPSRNAFVHEAKIRRIQREVDALVLLGHPNAPPVLEADLIGGWYAMPVANGNLDDLFDRGRLPWQALRAGLLGVAAVIARAHELELVHRDLHPGNVLIYPDRWCVADWGFVFNPRVSRQTRQMFVFGREFYIAPEIQRDPQVVKPAADIFAIGRLAERGAHLGPNRDSDGPAAAWWRTLINGAGAYDERQRWTITDVLAHLRAPLPMSRPAAVGPTAGDETEVCPNCGSPYGFDAACRCLRCHAIAY